MFGLPNSTITILSIDGGGIRGLIPALILKELEERLARRRNAQPLPRLFDLMAGTSTGGLIALGLCAPAITSDGHGYLSEPALTTDDLIRIYTDRGEEIFPPWKFRRLRSVLQAFGDKYDADSLAFRIGVMLQEARKSARLTQQELADAVNVTRQTIISLEHGRYNPSLELAHRITKAVKAKHIEDVFDLP